jgi:cytochrome c oxidase subunit IV
MLGKSTAIIATVTPHIVLALTLVKKLTMTLFSTILYIRDYLCSKGFKIFSLLVICNAIIAKAKAIIKYSVNS